VKSTVTAVFERHRSSPQTKPTLDRFHGQERARRGASPTDGHGRNDDDRSYVDAFAAAGILASAIEDARIPQSLGGVQSSVDVKA
jgi:hypothetical protein